MSLSFNPAPKETHKRSKTPKNIPSKLRKYIHERDKVCQLCGTKGDTIHHIISAGMGRRKKHVKENLVLLCGVCHHNMHNSNRSEQLQRWAEDWSREKYGNIVNLLIKELRK